MTRLQDLRIVKFSHMENPRWPLLLNTAEEQNQLFSRTIKHIGLNFAWNISGTLVFKIMKRGVKTDVDDI